MVLSKGVKLIRKAERRGGNSGKVYDFQCQNMDGGIYKKRILSFFEPKIRFLLKMFTVA